MLTTARWLTDEFFFFFSSRRRHTRWTGDWSSDVCSSDLVTASDVRMNPYTPHGWRPTSVVTQPAISATTESGPAATRSEERRGGKEGRSRWSASRQERRATTGAGVQDCVGMLSARVLSRA